MIKYNPKSWFSHILSFHKSDTFHILWKELIGIFIFTLALEYVAVNYFSSEQFGTLSNLTSVYSIIGFVLSLLLVFRTNTAYDRWWEGRKKWGELVNNSRNLAIKISSMSNDVELKNFFSRMISNYAYAMKEQLREGVIMSELDLEPEESQIISKAKHKTSTIAKLMYKRFNQMKQSGKLSEEEFIVVDTNLKTFSDIIGACERIKNTPIPFSYSLFLKKFIFIYVTTLPLAFITTFGYYASLVATLVFYVLVSLEVLAEEIEDPFGTDENDLSTDDLCAKIKENVHEILLDTY